MQPTTASECKANSSLVLVRSAAALANSLTSDLLVFLFFSYLSRCAMLLLFCSLLLSIQAQRLQLAEATRALESLGARVGAKTSRARIFLPVVSCLSVSQCFNAAQSQLGGRAHSAQLVRSSLRRRFTLSHASLLCVVQTGRAQAHSPVSCPPARHTPQCRRSGTGRAADRGDVSEPRPRLANPLDII